MNIGSTSVTLRATHPRRTIPLDELPTEGQKKILLAAPRGYCAGVDRAVVAVEKALWDPQVLLRLKEQELCSVVEMLQNGVRDLNAPDRSESVHHAGLPRPFGWQSRYERLPEA